MTMKRLFALFLLCASAQAQINNITVVADTNRVIRTNFTLVRSQVTDLDGATFAISNVTGLQTALDDKLTTNGSAAGLTNFPGNIIATNVSGVVALTNGGTGSSDVTNARVNLLPAYTNNASKVLALNTNATDVVWADGGANPIMSNAVGVLAVTNGGTGATNGQTSLTNLGIFSATDRIIILGTNSADRAVVIGATAQSASGATNSVALGFFARANDDLSIAIGSSSRADWERSIAIGANAYTATAASDAVQIGNGTNNTATTIQYMNAGKVTTNSWAALANAGTVGTNVLRSTNAAGAQAAIFPATTTNAPTNTNAPTPTAWLDVTVGTNSYKLPLWQ